MKNYEKFLFCLIEEETEKEKQQEKKRKNFRG